MATLPSQSKEVRRARELAGGPFQCPSCDVTIGRKSDFAYHLNIHTDKYKCTVCGKRNSRESTLTEHMKAKHTGGGETPQNQTQTQSQSLIKTQNVSQIQTQYQSQKQMQTNGLNVVQTMPMRSPEGLFLCPHCPSKVGREADFNVHMNIHTDKFKCTVCDKRHTRSSTLAEHMNMKHSELKDANSPSLPLQNVKNSGVNLSIPSAALSRPLWERIQNLHQKEHEMATKNKGDLPSSDLLQSAMDMADIPAEAQKVLYL